MFARLHQYISCDATFFHMLTRISEYSGMNVGVLVGSRSAATPLM